MGMKAYKKCMDVLAALEKAGPGGINTVDSGADRGKMYSPVR